MKNSFAPRVVLAGMLLSLSGLAGAADFRWDPTQPISTDIVVKARRAVPDAPDVLGTAALDAGVTIYDVRFRRVAAADRDDLRIQAMADQLKGLSPVAQLARVKQLVAARVRTASDLETMHVADYWSNAADTLTRGAGDDEDIAIVEMQTLRAAGFPSRDLYLSVGRHRATGMHVVLLARTDRGFYLVDDAERQVLAASDGAAAGFTPMMTIGTGRSWLHGYRGHGSATALASR